VEQNRLGVLVTHGERVASRGEGWRQTRSVLLLVGLVLLFCFLSFFGLFYTFPFLSCQPIRVRSGRGVRRPKRPRRKGERLPRPYDTRDQVRGAGASIVHRVEEGKAVAARVRREKTRNKC
jgi:hypothetical protein